VYGEAVTKQIGAVAYVECSAETGENVSEGLERAVRCTITYINRSKKHG
jgi:hypothetical protein